METTPTISMRPSARYVTRQTMFDNQRLGPLTDKRIDYYIKQGRYAPEVNAPTKKLKLRRKADAKPVSMRSKIMSLLLAK